MSWIDMAPEIETRIVSEPHLILIILPNKRSQWNVDGQRWRSFHWLSAKVGIAKHNHGARLQRESVLARGSGVVNFGKNHPSYASLGLNGLLKTFHGFLKRVVAGFRDQSGVGGINAKYRQKRKEPRRLWTHHSCSPPGTQLTYVSGLGDRVSE